MKLRTLPIIIVAAMAGLACQSQDTDVSFTAALEDNEKDFDWDEVDTTPQLEDPIKPLMLGEKKDLYMGRGTWNQSACSRLVVANPSQTWAITITVEDPDTELELEVAHCGIDNRDPRFVLTDATGYQSAPKYFPVDRRHDGDFIVSNFYFGRLPPESGDWPRQATFTVATEGEHFMVTAIRILSTGKIKMESPEW